TGSVAAPRKFFADGYAARRAAFSPGYYFEQQSKIPNTQGSPTANAKLQRRPAQRGPAAGGTCNSASCRHQEERPSHDKATGVTKGDRLTMALIALAVRGKRPRCSGPVDHVLWTSDDQRDRAIAALVA
ncbi:MAG TPA: hypothetical protein VI036_04335, partial [Propionibacteriaceae bacterium]